MFSPMPSSQILLEIYTSVILFIGNKNKKLHN